MLLLKTLHFLEVEKNREVSKRLVVVRSKSAEFRCHLAVFWFCGKVIAEPKQLSGLVNWVA
jgi:hypothetical protein